MGDVREALLGCPWCGREPTVFEDDSYGGCGVSCSHCDTGPDGCYRKIGQLDQAIAAWNTRFHPPADAATIERAARAIAYEMGDVMGDAEPVFWSGYNHKEASRKAARAALNAIQETVSHDPD